MVNKIEKYRNLIHFAWTKFTQEKLIDHLYELGFIFIDYDLLVELITIPRLDSLKNYKFLLRAIYRDEKNPTKDRLDFSCIWGIDLENRSSQVYIWLGLKPYKKGKKPWGKKDNLNFKPKKLTTKYPDFMSIQDRIDFRRIERKLVNRGLTKEEQDFYNRCAPAVAEINAKYIELKKDLDLLKFYRKFEK